MTLEAIVNLIPEANRPLVKAELDNYMPKSELSNYIKVESVEQIKDSILKNPILKSAVDSIVHSAVDNHDKKFQAEKLPSLVELEIAKRNPAKDPKDVMLSEMQRRLDEMERATVMEKQTILAITKANEHGIPVDIAKRYIGNNDEETLANIESLALPLKAWKETGVNEAVSKRLSGNGTPVAGSPPAPEDLKSKYEKALIDGNADLALALQSKMHNASK